MANPRFSIVVPTRERAETLHYALLTFLDQDFVQRLTVRGFLCIGDAQ